jgi:hypothetical protein
VPALNYSLSFSLSAVNYELQHICDLIGLTPAIRHIQGMPRFAPNGTSIGGLYKKHFARFNLDYPNMREPNLEISSFAERIIGCRDELVQLKASGGEIYITVMWVVGQNRGEVFEVETLKKLAFLGIDLGVEVFAE